MQSVFSAKSVLAAAIALGSLAAATGARAQGIGDAIVSVTVGAPARHAPVVVQPAPVYVQPAPVYVRPAPVPVQPRYVQAPPRRYDERGAWGDRDHDGIANRYDRYDNRYDHRHDRRDDRRVAMNGPWGDADRDGVPNRYDRAPYNPRFR